mmetsp:Transcript_9598/g.19871  ORF Transcript_9598/g.19871 Transcript_9598/m.19871 type:complete len:574 (+) Transcript_9598:41-1762(+)
MCWRFLGSNPIQGDKRLHQHFFFGNITDHSERMASPSSQPSPILAFFLNLTRFAGEKRVPVLEWILAWSTVVIFGLRYIIDYARLRWKLHNLAKSVVNSAVSSGGTTPSLVKQTGDDDTTSSLSDCLSLCPLAHTRKELSVGTTERWERLRRALFLVSSILDHDGEEKKDASMKSINGDSSRSVSQIADMTKEWADEKWVQVFRSNLDVRRETSHIMFAVSGNKQQPLTTKESMVVSKIRRLWPRFLELPRSVVTASNDKDAVYDISLIIPMYRERITDIASTLHKAFERCTGDPKKIQVVVAHAESKPNDVGNSFLREQLLLQEQQQSESHKKTSVSIWGELKVVTIPFGQGGGRGRTLNIGAGRATAPILTFLHADTLMPIGWDKKVKGALMTTSCEESFAHACAFTMAIDDENTCSYSTTPESTDSQPPGLLGAEWLGVLRCNCGLPYGDSVLSFGRPIFDYMGGYPDQPLMEDYEVMDWLRLRSVLLTTIHELSDNSDAGVTRGEHLVLLKDRAWCSPRRWNKYGVAYTSLINAVCILRYRNKATTEELFDFYYHCNSSNNASKGNKQK